MNKFSRLLFNAFRRDLSLFNDGLRDRSIKEEDDRLRKWCVAEAKLLEARLK